MIVVLAGSSGLLVLRVILGASVLFVPVIVVLGALVLRPVVFGIVVPRLLVGPAAFVPILLGFLVFVVIAVSGATPSVVNFFLLTPVSARPAVVPPLVTVIRRTFIGTFHVFSRPLSVFVMAIILILIIAVPFLFFLVFFSAPRLR